MVDYFMQALCIVLAVIGVFLLIIELKVKLHKSFMFFGINILLLCGFAGMDIWFKPNAIKNPLLLNIQHIFFCFFPPCMLSQLDLIKKDKIGAITRIFFLIAAILAIMFASNVMIGDDGGTITLTVFYETFFMVFFALSTFVLVWQNFKYINNTEGVKRSVFILHLIALFFLLCCGIVDLLNLFLKKYIFESFVSLTIIGVLILGIILMYRLITYLQHNKSLLSKVMTAYKDLLEAKSVISIGTSTAMTNYEIQNYLHAINFHVNLISCDPLLSQKSLKACENILVAVKNLMHFNCDFIERTREQIVSNRRPFDLIDIIRQCMDMDFTSQRKIFDYSELPDIQFMYGDEKRVRESFRRLFAYSLKKGATRISVKIKKDTFALLIIIEDNCSVTRNSDINGEKIVHQPTDPEDELEIIMATSAIEVNGGYLTLVAKNNFLGYNTGLMAYVSYPNYADYPWKMDENKVTVVIVKEGLGSLEHIITTFNNVFIHPYIADSAETVRNQFSPRYPVFGIQSALKALGDDYKKYILKVKGSQKVMVWGHRLNKQFLSEYVIIHDILKLNNPPIIEDYLELLSILDTA